MPNTPAQHACPTRMSNFVVRRNSTVPVPDLTAAVRARLPGPPRVEMSDDGRFALVAMSSAQLAVCAPDVLKCLAMESLIRYSLTMLCAICGSSLVSHSQIFGQE